MTDSLDGYRGRSKEQINHLLDVADALEGYEVDAESMIMFDLGLEAQARLKNDRLIRMLFDRNHRTLANIFHDWVHCDPTDVPKLKRLHYEAAVAKGVIDNLLGVVRDSQAIAERHQIEGADDE